MKKFYTDNMKLIHKFLLNQLAISLFGFMIIISMSSFGTTAMYVATAMAALFFCSLLYDNAWDEGARDRNKITNQRLQKRPLHGAKVALFSYIPTFVFVIPTLIFTGLALADITALEKVALFFRALAVFLCNGMYLGFSFGLAEIFPDTYTFFLVLYVLPALISYGLGYYLGTEDKQIKTVFGMAPTTNEPVKKKKQ